MPHSTGKNCCNTTPILVSILVSIHPCKQFTKDLMLFYDFIWNGKKKKKTKSNETSRKPLDEGGLNMTEVNVFIES